MIPVFRPSYGPEELEGVRQVLESGWSVSEAAVPWKYSRWAALLPMRDSTADCGTPAPRELPTYR
jgi:hypothetical protein